MVVVDHMLFAVPSPVAAPSRNYCMVVAVAVGVLLPSCFHTFGQEVVLLYYHMTYLTCLIQTNAVLVLLQVVLHQMGLVLRVVVVHRMDLEVQLRFQVVAAGEQMAAAPTLH